MEGSCDDAFANTCCYSATFSRLFVVNYGISSPRVISSALPERVETSTLAETS